MSKLASMVTGVGWGTVSVATVTVFQLVFMAVMARLLHPADFGLVAIANVSLRFFSYFSQMGIAPALVQKEALDEGDVRAALALSLGISAFFFLLAVICAGAVERYFGIESLAVVMQVLAINFIIFGFSSISLGLIRRNRKFRALAVIEIISYVFGYGLVGLGAAWYGAGVWALVAAFLAQTLLTAVMSYSVMRFPLGLKHTREQRRHILGYGGRYSIIGFIEFLTSNIDSLVIGKMMGSTVAGYYNRALLLANLPVQHPTRVLTQALFPILSSVSNQHDKQSISVQLGVLIVGCYAFAVSAGIAVAAPDIVRVLLGNKWLESIPVLQILAFSVGPIYTSNVIGVTLDSMAQLSVKLRIQAAVLLILVVLITQVAPGGAATGVAMAVVAACWCRLLLMGMAVVRLMKIPVREVLRIILSIFIVAAGAGILVAAVPILFSAGSTAVVRLVAEVLGGALGMAIGLFLVRSIVSGNQAVVYLASRMPRIAGLLRI